MSDRPLVPRWLGLGLYAGYTVARGLTGFGAGGLAAGLSSLPDAPNAPGLWPGIAGSAGSVGSLGSTGPGGGLLCPPPPRTGRPREYEPDLEDELMWLSLRKAVPGLEGWDDFPGDHPDREPPPGDIDDEEPAGASIHGFGGAGGASGHGSPEGGDTEGAGGDQAPGPVADTTDPGADGHRGAEPDPAGDAPSIHGFGDGGPGPSDPEAEPEPEVGDGRRERMSGMRLIRTRPCAAVATLGLLVALVALGFELAYLRRLANPSAADIARNAGYGAWAVGWMMLVTFTIRTMRLRDVVRFWLVGFFAATGIVGLVGAAVTAGLEPGLLRTAIVIPILEEAVKVLILVAFLVVAVRGRHREPSITDLMIIGFALGAAFGVHEDGLWVRVTAEGFGSGLWGTLFPVFNHDPIVVVGHAGWGGLAGLGVGLGWHLRRHRAAWVAAVIPPALAIFDHVSFNYAVVEAIEGTTRGAGWTMREMIGHGSRVAALLLAGFALAVVIDWLTLRRRCAARPLPAWSTGAGIRERLRALPGARARVLGAILLLGERRSRLGFRYAIDRAASTQPPAATGGG